MHFLITCGGTREHIDPVRFISNASSGTMGVALARAAISRGDKVTLISAPISLKLPAKAKVINVETVGEMFEAVKKHFPKCDCLIMAAAVSDYTPAYRSKTKIKKSSKALIIKLKPTKDILKWAGENKTKQFIAGFALEDKAVRASAEKKLVEKNLDMIIANTPEAIGCGSAAVEIKLSNDEWQKIPAMKKSGIAARIIRLIKTIRLDKTNR
ncbi:MAG: phosphopantothenoylcysteine decarboxylase [Sedimentisphaerales bacterium]|nr:phosphopantothenoylcysteine decarboxylase [Sedimentisphaerales bacterium]